MDSLVLALTQNPSAVCTERRPGPPSVAAGALVWGTDKAKRLI